jgi:xanthosine utilization system XapX-like protein
MFVPVGDLMRQLVLAMGAAMVVGSIAVLVRERRRAPEDVRPRPNWRIVGLNLVIGLVLTVWGVSSIMVAG